ncbi:DUF1127 domain-containing protein [Paracoccus pacificus]|uniref:DUF1127 domain-containing protein n=1 Tax=Paracoccus pacificus TaxID=1463598 RepID=A0ABW4R9I6_9RHOB
MAQKSSAMLNVAPGRVYTGIRANWLRRILTAVDLRQSRLALARLSDEQLRDVGLTPEQAKAEARRSMWDVPEHFGARH